MTPTDHLQLILTRCRELLAIAERRTAGVWRDRLRPNGQAHIEDMEGHSLATVWTPRDEFDDNDYHYWQGNRAFIAACAGPAEAGWRSTIAAIEGVLETITMCEHHIERLKGMRAKGLIEDDDFAEAVWQMPLVKAEQQRDAILAAWPIELLTK